MGFHKYEMFKFGYFSSREEDDIVSGIFVFTFEFLWKKSGLLSPGKTNISLV